jgi:hypothetical protein
VATRPHLVLQLQVEVVVQDFQPRHLRWAPVAALAVVDSVMVTLEAPGQLVKETMAELLEPWAMATL